MPRLALYDELAPRLVAHEYAVVVLDPRGGWPWVGELSSVVCVAEGASAASGENCRRRLTASPSVGSKRGA